MALPTQKSTKSRKKKRTATLKLKRKKLVRCSQCQKMIVPHRACPFCGTYAGKKILRIKSRFDKSRKKAEKEKNNR